MPPGRGRGDYTPVGATTQSSSAMPTTPKEEAPVPQRQEGMDTVLALLTLVLALATCGAVWSFLDDPADVLPDYRRVT
jgi:hypothetical protein